MDVYDKISDLAYAFDNSPVAPATLGKKLFRLYLHKREERASSDPTWAAIEERRNKEGRGPIFLSDDLTFADWETQQQIEKELTPEPWWLPAALKLRDVSVAGLLGRAHNTYQLARQGWSDYDVSEMTSVLPRRIGEMLLRMADTAHGWPESTEFPTFEDWTNALRHHGNILTGKSEEDGEVNLLNAWHTLATDPLSDPEETEAASKRHTDAEEARAEKVRLSLQWVVDHYQLLWS